MSVTVIRNADWLVIWDGASHAIFLDHHPWLHWTSRIDLDHLADSGASVAHCPTVFARRSITLRSFGEYLRRGINLGLGASTQDTHGGYFLRG